MHDYQLFIGTTNIDTTSTDSATHMSGMRIQACASLCDSVVEDATHLCLLLAQLLPLACLLLTLIGCGTLIECEDCRFFKRLRCLSAYSLRSVPSDGTSYVIFATSTENQSLHRGRTRLACSECKRTSADNLVMTIDPRDDLTRCNLSVS